MTDVLSIMDLVARREWFSNAGKRRAIFGGSALLLAFLCVFPPKYTAITDLAPQDTYTAGLSGILSQLDANYAALLGNHQPLEVDLSIARSFQVMRETARRAGILGQGGSEAAAVRKVERMTEVEALRGGIIELSASGHDADYALRLVDAYSRAIEDRLTTISLDQTKYKREVLNSRMAEASERLTRADAALNAFRTKYQLPDPETQLGAQVAELTSLQASLQAKQVELQTALRFNTEESHEVKAIRSDIATLETELHQAQQEAKAPVGLTATGIAQISAQYGHLYRQQKFAQSLYDSYSRYLEGVAIEELASDFNMRPIQTPYIDPFFEFNTWAVFSLFALVLVAVGSEIYLARPPLRRFAAR